MNAQPNPPSGIPPAARSAPRAPGKLAQLDDAVLVAHARLGDTEALDALLHRHLKTFLRHARLRCDNPTDAEDICQDAVLQAISHLSHLEDAGAFRPWVLGFINSEASHWRRKLKKVGTLGREPGTYILESMSVEPASSGPGSGEDMTSLLHLLRQRSVFSETACRQIAAFMLDHYEEREELPSIRTLAQAAHTSRSSADRRCRAVMQAWRRILAASGLWAAGRPPTKQTPPPVN